MAKYAFTYHQEIGHQGQSLVPHFPGGLSGVTIGPGYDMGSRTPSEIFDDLTKAGIPSYTAEKLMEAAYKTGPEAQAWVEAHRHELAITEAQQEALFDHVLVDEYERRVRSQLVDFANQNDSVTHDMIAWENLSEKQKHILFDFAYNPGLSKFPTLTEAVLQEDWDTVAISFERFSAGEPLAYRNDMFYSTFLDPNAPPLPSDTEIAEVIEIVETPDTETIEEVWENDLYTEIPTSMESFSVPEIESDKTLDNLLDEQNWHL
ncbi:pesticin C-terminus-like muramidase [Runella sp. MFBS21]|uniref:pesticin C-terminus-like muramidase n=1 Tax=Runella sp. MFBS21 TaxID=3034018 RepID=UPI0023F85ABC|nr:pesticin C-terminus-like muramidase [Runella sp. MFBS21]MDF7820376.1 pesticin C-terminus-like muramidase [Runella sp. MFBS21]